MKQWMLGNPRLNRDLNCKTWLIPIWEVDFVCAAAWSSGDHWSRFILRAQLLLIRKGFKPWMKVIQSSDSLTSPENVEGRSCNYILYLRKLIWYLTNCIFERKRINFCTYFENINLYGILNFLLLLNIFWILDFFLSSHNSTLLFFLSKSLN